MSVYFIINRNVCSFCSVVYDDRSHASELVKIR